VLPGFGHQHRVSLGIEWSLSGCHDVLTAPQSGHLGLVESSAAWWRLSRPYGLPEHPVTAALLAAEAVPPHSAGVDREARVVIVVERADVAVLAGSELHADLEPELGKGR
jgi:hypothetical protein